MTNSQAVSDLMWPHCHAMLKSRISHNGFSARATLFRKKGFSWRSVAENVAMNYGASRTADAMAKSAVG